MKKILIVVDMQNDFITGSLGSSEAQAIVPAVIDKIKAYKDRGDEIIFTVDTHREDYLNTQEGKKLPVPHCVKGTDGWKLHEEIGKFQGRRFEKDNFGSLECAGYLSMGDYESAELVGLCTDICVISNALLIKVACPDLPITVDSSCCAGVTPQSHENALSAMKMCQIDII